jgi:hypothetical protein
MVPFGLVNKGALKMLKEISPVASSMLKLFCLWSMGLEWISLQRSIVQSVPCIKVPKESQFVVLTLVYSPKGKRPIMGYE